MKKLKRIYGLSVASMFAFGALGFFGLAGAAGSLNALLLILGIVSIAAAWFFASLADAAAERMDLLRDLREQSFRG